MIVLTDSILRIQFSFNFYCENQIIAKRRIYKSISQSILILISSISHLRKQTYTTVKYKVLLSYFSVFNFKNDLLIYKCL